MAPGRINNLPPALQYGGNTSVVVIKEVKPVCSLPWILIKHPFGGCAAEKETKNKLLLMSVENWE